VCHWQAWITLLVDGTCCQKLPQPSCEPWSIDTGLEKLIGKVGAGDKLDRRLLKE